MRTIDSLLTGCASAHPRRLAISFADDSATFGEVDAWSDGYAHALQAWGVVPGDIVPVVAEISLDLVYLYFAMARLGAVFVPVDPRMAEAELLDICRYLGTGKIITDYKRQDIGSAVCGTLGTDIAVLSHHEAPASGPLIGKSAALARHTPFLGEPVHEEDPQAIYLTSGSTGKPKGVVISHRASWIRSHLDHRLNSSRGSICTFSLSHMAGWSAIQHAWAARRPVHLLPRADGEPILSAIERWGASSIYAIPAVWRRVLDCKTPAEVSSLRAADTGTSFVDGKLILDLRERFPNTTNGVGYGSTEIGSGLWLSHEDVLDKLGSVGLPTAGVEAQIVDEELVIKSEALMDGYFKLPEETADCLSDGWYRTGDLVEKDSDGFFSIVGRRREIIRSGGKAIAPVEVEQRLSGLEGVVDLAIIGLPDLTWGEIVCAAIVRAPASSPVGITDLHARLQNIASFKRPRKIVEVPSIPRTPVTGQIQRDQLRKNVVSILAIGQLA